MIKRILQTSFINFPSKIFSFFFPSFGSRQNISRTNSYIFNLWINKNRFSKTFLQSFEIYWQNKYWLHFYFAYLQYGQRVPTAASPSNTNSSSSSNTGSQSGTLSTSLSNTHTNHTMGPSMTPQQHEQLSKTNLYIRGLQQGTTDKDLHNMCSQ